MIEPTNEELCALAQDGDKPAREQLIENNSGYIRQIVGKLTANPARARQFASCGIEPDDLFQAGCMGLLSAMDSFDPANEVKFLTYSDKAIQNAMVDLIRQYSQDAIWRLSTDKLQPQRIIYLDKELGISDSEDAAEETVGDTLASPFCKLPEQLYIEQETKEEVREAVDALPDREKTYIQFRFGLDDEDAHPRSEAARHFRLSESRAKAVERSALKAVKHELLVEIPKRAYLLAEDRLTKLLVAEGELHAVELRIKSRKKRRKKTTAAVYEYRADCDGEWGELYIDFSGGTVEIRSLADWDTVVSHRFAMRAGDWFRDYLGNEPPDRITLTFISPDQRLTIRHRPAR